MSTASHARRMSRAKKLLILGGTVTAVAGSGAAYAYWTGTGTGTGSGSSSTAGSVTVVQTSTISNVNPGRSPQTLSGNFTNSSANGDKVWVTQVVASFSVTKAAGAPSGTCTTSDYTLSGATMTVGQEISPGTAQGSWSGATIAFNDTTANQDACKGATLTFSYAAS